MLIPYKQKYFHIGSAGENKESSLPGFILYTAT